MTKNGFDCAVKLTAAKAKQLKSLGFCYVARYLGDSWKTFNKEEAKVIQDAELNLVSIFQKSANYAGYHTKAQGISDANEAMKYAKSVGQPSGTAIYFAVDFDVQQSHMASILAYVDGVKSALKDYKMGLYGSYAVMLAVKGKVDYYWQTYAWSKGKVADFIHMYQYQNDVTVAGIILDRNDIKKNPGHWVAEIKPVSKPTEKPAAQSVKTYKVVKAVPGYLTAADAKANKNKKTTIAAGTYTVFNESQGMFNITSNAGTPGSWINPAENKVSVAAPKNKKVGQKVKVKSSATKYATGETIPGYVKGTAYTISQVKSDRVLLKEIMSWLKITDVQ